ncbi:MAG: permease [Enterovirga sp.]|nr:permease [Enterovirga sp.]
MRAGTLAWFARHEFRLAWRDLAAIAAGGGRRRVLVSGLVLTLLAIVMHALAWSFVSDAVRQGLGPDPTTLVVVSGSVVLCWCLILSQAIESVTRAFYARGDLDLVLSSPVRARRLFAVRTAGIAATASAMAVLLATPAIDVLVVLDGPRWLLSHLAVMALAISAAALATAIAAALFCLLGPARTRFAAQILAAIVGAAFAVGVQAAAILSFDDPSRISLLSSSAVVGSAPGPDSPLWWPARALLGDGPLIGLLLAGSVALLVAVVALVAPRFAEAATAAAGTTHLRRTPAGAAAPFRRRSPSRLLREKEWTLLVRDPWLASQTLMQILYLLPAALLLWRSFGGGTSSLAVLVPVLVMAAGQLAGGLAWLAVSGEDAPDLIATAPVSSRQVIRAKIEAVLGAVAVVTAPLLVGVALLSPVVALVATVGIALAAASSTAIQLWFRSQAKRSNFRRRQTASRIATFSEAFSSILWACAAAFAAHGVWVLSAILGLICAAALLGVRAMSPRSPAGT